LRVQRLAVGACPASVETLGHNSGLILRASESGDLATVAHIAGDTVVVVADGRHDDRLYCRGAGRLRRLLAQLCAAERSVVYQKGTMGKRSKEFLGLPTGGSRPTPPAGQGRPGTVQGHLGEELHCRVEASSTPAHWSAPKLRLLRRCAACRCEVRALATRRNSLWQSIRTADVVVNLYGNIKPQGVETGLTTPAETSTTTTKEPHVDRSSWLVSRPSAS